MAPIMSVSAAATSTVVSKMKEAERAIRQCLDHGPTTDTEVKKIRIALDTITQRLAAESVTDPEILEQMEDLERDYSCLDTRVSIAAKKRLALSKFSSSLQNGRAETPLRSVMLFHLEVDSHAQLSRTCRSTRDLVRAFRTQFPLFKFKTPNTVGLPATLFIAESPLLSTRAALNLPLLEKYAEEVEKYVLDPDMSFACYVFPFCHQLTSMVFPDDIEETVVMDCFSKRRDRLAHLKLALNDDLVAKQTLDKIFQQCPALWNLELNCRDHDSLGCKALPSHLQSLTLENINEVPQDVLIARVSGCSQLQHLRMFDPNVSFDVLPELLSKLKQLQSLDVSGYWPIAQNDAMMIALSNHCPRLRHLRIGGVEFNGGRLDRPDGLIAEEIIRFLPGITQDGLQRLQQAFGDTLKFEIVLLERDPVNLDSDDLVFDSCAFCFPPVSCIHRINFQ